MSSHLKTRSILVSAFLALGPFFSEIVTGQPSSGTVECPLSVMHTRIYVPVALDGQPKPSWWLVDTGAPRSLVDAAQAKQLIRTVPGRTELPANVAGEKYKVLFQVESTVGGYRMGSFDFLESPLVGLMDRNHLQDVGYLHPFNTGGILGVNFLVEHAALLDFRSGLLVLASNNASLA